MQLCDLRIQGILYLLKSINYTLSDVYMISSPSNNQNEPTGHQTETDITTEFTYQERKNVTEQCF